jgi:formylglycine-generating enzyme required for sulfatase activity
VVLTRGFLIATTPITTAQYQVLMQPRAQCSEWHVNAPQASVTWLDAAKFCNALSRVEGIEAAYAINDDNVQWVGLDTVGYRLPTEAEWEYACRAGTTGARYGELDEIAWHYGNANGLLHDVRQKQPNAWGLYDMLGNAGEWCWDRYGDYPMLRVTDPLGPDLGFARVLRGGGFRNGPDATRAARRATTSTTGVGAFRPVRSLPP